MILLKHLSNFWRTLNIPSLNCVVNLTLSWSKNCLLTDMTIQVATPAQEENLARLAINPPAGVTFNISDPKLYISVVNLSTEDDN